MTSEIWRTQNEWDASDVFLCQMKLELKEKVTVTKFHSYDNTCCLLLQWRRRLSILLAPPPPPPFQLQHNHSLLPNTPPLPATPPHVSFDSSTRCLPATTTTKTKKTWALSVMSHAFTSQGSCRWTHCLLLPYLRAACTS